MTGNPDVSPPAGKNGASNRWLLAIPALYLSPVLIFMGVLALYSTQRIQVDVVGFEALYAVHIASGAGLAPEKRFVPCEDVDSVRREASVPGQVFGSARSIVPSVSVHDAARLRLAIPYRGDLLHRTVDVDGANLSAARIDQKMWIYPLRSRSGPILLANDTTTIFTPLLFLIDMVWEALRPYFALAGVVVLFWLGWRLCRRWNTH